MKKHISQMSPSEIDLLEFRRKYLLCIRKPFTYSKHFFDIAKKRGVKPKDAEETVIQGNIIEFHDRIIDGKVIDKRVLLRSKKTYKENYNLCVVYSLWYKRIITAYYNHITNNHEKTDFSMYDGKYCITLLRN